jgi:hypothetical protein
VGLVIVLAVPVVQVAQVAVLPLVLDQLLLEGLEILLRKLHHKEIMVVLVLLLLLLLVAVVVGHLL